MRAARQTFIAPSSAKAAEGSVLRSSGGAKVGAASALAACLVVGCYGTPDDGRPSLSPDPGSISFNVAADSTDPVSAPATLTFDGAETVVFSATKDQAWLSVDPASGFVGFGGAVEFVVTADPTGLTEGLWVGHVFFEDVGGGVPGGVLTVALYVNVDEAPGGLTVSPNPAALHALLGYAAAATKEVTLSYSGGATALVSASSADGWLTTDLADDTPMDPGETVTVTLSAATGRALGLYTSSVTFTRSSSKVPSF